MAGSDSKPVVEIVRPNPRPLAHGKRELFAVEMGVRGKSAADAWRAIEGLEPDAPVSSTAYMWAAKAEVKERVKHLRMEMARREQDRLLVDRNKVVTELWSTYEDARDAGNFAGRTKSLELLGKDAGMFQGADTPKKIEDLPDDQLAAEFNRLIEEAAKSGSREAGSAAGAGEGAEEPEAPELHAVSEAG